MNTPFKLLLLAFTAVCAITGCHAQSSEGVSSKNDTTATNIFGKHHFKFTDHGMFYNGVPFRLGDSIQQYVKLFGLYDREHWGVYTWDSLGMMVVERSPQLKDAGRVAIITWLVSYPAKYADWDTSAQYYKNKPKYLISSPLEFEKRDCYVLIEKNMRMRKFLNTATCFHQSVIHIVYETAASSKPEDYYHRIYYYVDSETYDMAEAKTPYNVVKQFEVSTED